MKQTGKRGLAALLAAVMVMSLGSTALAAAAPEERALEASRLDDLPRGNVLYLGTAAAVVEEENAVYSVPLYREGDLSGEASVTLRTLDLTAVYGKDYELLANDVEVTGDGVSMLERAVTAEPPEPAQSADAPDDAAPAAARRDSGAESSLARLVEEQTGRPTRDLYESPDQTLSLVNTILAGAVPEQMQQIDYSSQTTITFAPGEAEKTLRFRILDDRQSEGSEGFSLLLVDPRGAELCQVTSLGVTIQDNEPAERPTVSFSADSYTAADGSVTVTVERTGAEYALCSFTLQSVGETAVAGENYTEIREDFVFAPYETERSFTIPVTGEGIFSLKMSGFTACDPGQYTAADIILPYHGGKAVLSGDSGALTGTKSMNIKVDGNKYTVRYTMPSDGDKGAAMGTIVDTGFTPELEVGQYFFSLNKKHGGMFNYGDSSGTDPGWRGHTANHYNFKNTGDMDVSSHYGSLEYYSSWVGDKGKETAMTDDVFPDYYQSFVPDWCSTSWFGGGQEFQIVYGNRTGDIEGCGDFDRTQSNNCVRVNGMGISDGHYVRVKAVDDTIWKTPKSYLEFYGVAAMYKRLNVSLDTPNELTYQLGDLQTKSLAMQAHLKSGAQELYTGDRDFYANPDAGQTNLVVNLDPTELNGHSGIYGHVTGFLLTITGGNYDKSVSVNYPSDYLTYLQNNKSAWVASEAKIKEEEINAVIDEVRNNPAVIPYDRFFFCWLESVQSDIVKTDQGYYQKLSIKPVVDYNDVTVEVLEPALGAGTGHFTNDALSKPGTFSYHAGDTLNLSAEAADPTTDQIQGYEVSTNNGVTFDTITSSEYLFLETGLNYKIRPVVSPILNKIEIVFSGEADKHLTVQGLFKEGDDGELAKDPELSQFKNLHILKANPPDDPKEQKSLLEQMEPIKGKVYTINFTCEEDDTSIYLPVITNGNHTYHTNSYHHVAAAAVGDNVIQVACEKVDKSALTAYTVTGTLMSDFRPVRFNGMETIRLPVPGYTVTAGTNTQTKDQKGEVMPQAAVGLSEEDGTFTLAGVQGRSGDWITVTVTNGVTNGQVLPVQLGDKAAMDMGECKLQYPYGAPQVMDQMVTCKYDKDENNKDLDPRSNQIRICDDNLNLTATVNLNGSPVDTVVFTTYTLKGVKTEYPAELVSTDGKLSIFTCKIKKMTDVLHPGDRVSVRLAYVGDGKAPPVVYPDVDTGFMFYTSNEVVNPQTYDLTGMKIDIPLVGSATGTSKSGLLSFDVTRWDDTPDGTPTGYSMTVNADAMVSSRGEKTAAEKIAKYKEFHENAKDVKLSKDRLSGAERLYANLMSDEDPDSHPIDFWQDDLADKRSELKDAKEALAGLDPAKYKVEIAVVLVFDFVYEKDKDQYLFSCGTVAVGGTFEASKTFYTVVMGVPVFLNLEGKIQANVVVNYVTEGGKNAMTAGEFSQYTGNIVQRLSADTTAKLLLNLSGKISVGVGMCGVLDASGYVAMNLEFDIPLAGTASGALLQIGGGIKFDLVVISLDVELVKYTTGWGTLEKTSSFSFINGLAQVDVPSGSNGNSEVVVSSDQNQLVTAHPYDTGTGDFSAFAQDPLNADNGTRVLLPRSAERSSPQVISLGGDKLLTVFLADKDGIQTLHWSVFNGFTWSAPAPVTNDGTLDAMPELEQVGDKVLIAWTDASEPFEDGEMLHSQLRKLGISCVVYDPDTNTMSEKTALIQDGYVNLDPAISTDGDKAYVTYMKRDLGDRQLSVEDAQQLLDFTDIYSVMARVCVDPDTARPEPVNGVVETFLSVRHPDLTEPPVTDHSSAALQIGGNSWLVETYTVDTDGDMVNTVADRELYLAVTNLTKNKSYNPIQITANSESPSAPKLTALDGEVWLSWLTEGYVFHLSNVSDLLTALFAPVNDTQEGSVLLDTAAIAAAYGQAEGTDWSWYKKTAADLNMDEEQFQGSVYDDLARGELRTYDTVFWQEDDLQNASGSYQLVTDGTDLYVFFTDCDTDPAVSGKDLCGLRFRPQGEDAGFTGGVRLTDGSRVFDEVDLTMSESGRLTAVANCYSLLRDGEDGLRRTSNSLVQLGLTPDSKLALEEDSVSLPEDLSPGSVGAIGFTLENNGLKDAAGYTVDAVLFSGGTKTAIGSVTAQEPLKGGGSRDLTIGWTVPAGISGGQIELTAQPLDETGQPVGASDVIIVHLPEGAELRLDDMRLDRGETDGEAHLTALLRNTGVEAASDAQVILSLCDSSGTVLQTLDAGTVSALAPGAEQTIDLVFTPEKSVYNSSGFTEVKLTAVAGQDSDTAYGRLFQSLLTPVDRWASRNNPEPTPQPGGGGGGAATHPVTASASTGASHGAVAFSTTNAKAGDKVTVTVTPDPGYQVADVTVKDAKGDPVPVTKNADGTWTFTMPDTAVTVEPVFTEAGRFVDVPKDAYYSDAVDWAVEKGITNGVDDTHFAPDATVTRGQTVTFLYRFTGEKTDGDNPFTDVPEDAYYHDAVLWAVANNVTNGTAPGIFSPDDDCTRAQIVTFLYRAEAQA